MDLLTTTYKDKIEGALGCLDRVIITGTIPQICYSQGMTSYLYSQNIRIFDYAKFAEPFKEELRANAEETAKKNGIGIEFVRKSHIRKEDLIKKVLDKRGYHNGLVHILSAMESCNSYQPWHDKKPDNIAAFLGHKVDPRYQGEMGNNYNIRIEGSRIKHSMGKSSIKMYDKFSKILRIETTTNDVSFFKHYREVEHRDGTKTMKTRPVKKEYLQSYSFIISF